MSYETFFVKVKEKIERAPFFKKSIKSVTVVAGAIDVFDSVSIASNKSMPLNHRIVNGVKAGCCTTALFLAYTSAVVPSPRVQAAFRVCCGFATSAYLFTGGDVGVALSITAVSNRTTTITSTK